MIAVSHVSRMEIMSLAPYQADVAPKKKRGRPNKNRAPDMATVAAGDIVIPQDAPTSADTNVSVDPETGVVQIANDDGSVTIDPTGASLFQKPDTPDTFDENLALKIDPIELSRIGEDLLMAVEADKSDRSQWEQMRAKCVELLGMKLDDPKGDVSRSSMGMSTSVVRDPILLEAVERFRANAYAELCPSAGPVKVVNFSDQKTGSDELAEALEKDLNFYLTTTASEYYPDTRYMLWWTGLASGTFKKVYRCPLRQRPVSEYVDGTDLIVPASATDLKNSPRVTHQVAMPRDIMRAMQLEGVYLDVPLADPMQPMINAVAQKTATVSGKAPQSQRVEDQNYTVYECYCKLDIKGYEHKIKGKPTGLPLPYRVTIEEGTRQVLEIRRNWDADADKDDVYRPPLIPFVLFPYSTGISRIYGSGLGQMMGNMASALTALLRISIDQGMMANYPGLLMAKGSGRQVQNQIMVPPGGAAEVDTGGLPIQQCVMPMPFKDVSQGVVSLIEQTRAVAQRLGGTADMPVGEGRQDAPVGTTLAMIEQATKVEGSVHKALHAAQGEEFRLLVRLFRDDPEPLWRGNRRPAMGMAADENAKKARLAKFAEALENCDIVPMADPNVPSGMHRNIMATGFKQFTTGNPAYDAVKVDRYVARQMFKISNADFDQFLVPPQAAQPPQIDPAIMAQLQIAKQNADTNQLKVTLQAQQAEKALTSKENIESLKIASAHAKGQQSPDQGPVEPDPIQIAELQLKHRDQNLKEADMALKYKNAQSDRETKLSVEALKMAQATSVHPMSDPIVDEQLSQMAPLITPAVRSATASSVGGGMAKGGPVRVARPSVAPPWSMPIAAPRMPVHMREPEVEDLPVDDLAAALMLAERINQTYRQGGVVR